MDFFQKIREKEAKVIKPQIDFKEIKAKDVMIKPIFLYEKDKIETITNKLKSEEANYCIVVDKNKNFLWEITIENLIKIIAHSSINEPLVEILDIWYKRGINHTSTINYIKKHKNTVKENARLFDILKLIDKKGFQYIPVLDKKNKVIWLITASSILRFIIKN